jgi:hypothetical protein
MMQFSSPLSKASAVSILFEEGMSRLPMANTDSLSYKKKTEISHSTLFLLPTLSVRFFLCGLHCESS